MISNPCRSNLAGFFYFWITYLVSGAIWDRVGVRSKRTIQTVIVA